LDFGGLPSGLSLRVEDSRAGILDLEAEPLSFGRVNNDGPQDHDAEESRPQKRQENRPIIRLLQVVDVCFARIYHRLSVRAPPRLPRHGAAILVCNHVSALDPLLIQSVCPRLLTWMVAKEYVEARGLRWIFQTIKAIPVARSGRDLAATRAAMRALSNGAVLGIFPEGKIETTTELLPFQTGVALMAIKTNTPVFPVYLEGSQRGMDMVPAMIRPNVASIAFGPAVNFDRSSTNRAALEAATQKIETSVRDLRDKCGKRTLR
jgi:1-acyl-sn-glycerol-3-phosphate acyltransferase